MGRCKNCKHYTGATVDVALDGYRKAATCKHPKFLIGYGHSLDEMSADGLMIENDEGWAWVVGPEFGCVHFEQKAG